jgi:hypothetical protein
MCTYSQCCHIAELLSDCVSRMASRLCKRMDTVCQIMRMMRSIALTGYIQESAFICSTHLMCAKILVKCLGLYMQAYALYLSFQPFSISAVDDHGPHSMLENLAVSHMCVTLTKRSTAN